MTPGGYWIAGQVTDSDRVLLAVTGEFTVRVSLPENWVAAGTLMLTVWDPFAATVVMPDPVADPLHV